MNLTKLWRALRRPTALAALTLSMLIVAAFRPDNQFEVAKNVDIFTKVMREVMMNYVDEVEPNQFARFGLDAMLKTLDPYTDFISAAEIDDYRFMSTGQYGGIGARILKREKQVFITELYITSPAHKAGLRAGDELIQIDNEKLTEKDYSDEQVSNLLKGQPKTPVRLVVKRALSPEPIALTVTREDIRVPNLEFSTLLSTPRGPVAYVVLTGFTREASAEVRKALEQLKTKAGAGGLKGIVLDLRGNPGGLLGEAINVSNLFVAKGEKIVETKGRMDDASTVHEAPNSPFDLETPLVVLINRGSASASEIVAGVVQDLDRGVILGRRSFGKGLVQTQRPLSYNTMIKITTARYYTPSGRCIQAVDYSHNDAEGGVVRRADSLKKAFSTRRGRKVLDSGGIEPEVNVPELELSNVAADLRNEFVVFDFASHYRARTPQIAPPSSFAVDDALYAEFTRFAAERKFAYRSRATQQLTALEEQLKKESVHETVKPQLEALRKAVEAQSALALQQHRANISLLLKRELAGRYYFQAGEHEVLLSEDTDLQAALKLLGEPERYSALLKPAVKE